MKKAPKPEYEVTSQEQIAIRKFVARRAASPAPRLNILIKKKKIIKFSPDHPDEYIGRALLMEALGTADEDFLNGLLEQLAHTVEQGGQISEHGLNFMVSVVKDIKPKDQIEAMLAAQMAAVHMATMTVRSATYARRKHTAAGQRRARFQQARPHLCNPDGGAQTLPNRWRAEGHRATCVGQRRRPSDRGECDAGPTRDRAGQGCGVTARTRRLTDARKDDCG